jgi:hypothetical protein
MQIKSTRVPGKVDSPAQDAARYGRRLSEIGEGLAMVSGEDAARARELLKGAADAAEEASRLMDGTPATRLRLHLNMANQPDLMVEATRYLLERQAGNTPVTLHQGMSQQSLPFAVNVTPRLITRLRALLGDEAVWTEDRKK